MRRRLLAVDARRLGLGLLATCLPWPRGESLGVGGLADGQ